MGTPMPPPFLSRSLLGRGVAIAVFATWAAAALAASGVQVAPGGRRTLVSKDVAGERWAITCEEDGTIVGNVFRPVGGPPSFVWCDRQSDDGNVDPYARISTLDCYGADACVAAPCAVGAGWSFIASVSLPGSFCLPPAAGPTATPEPVPSSTPGPIPTPPLQAEGTWTACDYDYVRNDFGDCDLTRMSLGSRYSHGAAALDGEIYIVGGLSRPPGTPFDASSAILDSVEAYDPIADRWRSDIASLPFPLYEPNVAAAGGRLYVLGFRTGFDGDPSGLVLVYDPERDVWEQRSPMPAGTQRTGSGVAVLDGRIFIAGGSQTGAPRVGDFSAYDPESDTWEVLPNLLAARSSLDAVAVGGVFFAIGGFDRDPSNNPWHDPGSSSAFDAYEPESRRWTSRTQIPRATSSASVPGNKERGGDVLAAEVDGVVYVIGGTASSPSFWPAWQVNDAYDVANDRWTRMTPVETRTAAQAVALGGRIYVVGGYVIWGSTDTIVAFKPPAS